MDIEQSILNMELGEARSEIARHHRDFAVISELLSSVSDDDWAALPTLCPEVNNVLKRIRNIVG